MTPQMEAALDAKHGAFYVTAYSAKRGRYCGVGKPHPTIKDALAASVRLERTKRFAGQMLFIDTVA